MKNSSKIARIAFIILGICSINSQVSAQAYYRVQAETKTPAPKPNNNGTQYFALNGQEIVPYAYGYVSNLPDDNNWRWIDERCYKSRKGTTCVQGHWVKKSGKSCEQVTGHTIKTGKYTRVINGGKVNTCQN